MEKKPVIIWVRVQPDASQNEVLGFKDGVLQVRIAAPPIKGKANQELIKYLSRILGISKRHLTIKKGLTSKLKAISISGLTPNQVSLDKTPRNPASSEILLSHFLYHQHASNSKVKVQRYKSNLDT